MSRFLVLGGITLVVVSVLTAVMSNAVARSIATREAEVRTLTFTRVIAAPELDAATLQDMQDSPLVQDLDNRLLDDSISHAAVYDADGLVMWSAEPDAVGTTVSFEQEVRDLVGGSGVVSHFSRETHAGGGEGELVLEVYATARGADGAPFVLEWYWPTSHLGDSQAQVLRLLLPTTLGSLLLFAALILPLTLSTARRVERDRARLTRQALQASRVERRRLSEVMHDTVVQDLSGIGYILPMLRRAIPESAAEHAMVTQIQEAMRRNISTIRDLIADIRPVDLRGDGLQQALEDLAARTEEQGVQTEVRVLAELDRLSPSARSLVYRVAREGTRNVLRHSGARQAVIEVAQEAPHVRVTVRDDGAGPGDGATALRAQDTHENHFGLSLLREAVADLDGDLVLVGGPGGGSELVVRFRPDRVLA
ncbi:sensor histidine kinase [Serinicoccus chungangensis]|uniref:sensor histidine kinase n=1 Tax=Serinicoccus chungangensis TaxID=767452 RepID=UPI0013053B30|nr:histidine kinase [Serinicoccus chungangensis]